MSVWRALFGEGGGQTWLDTPSHTCAVRARLEKKKKIGRPESGILWVEDSRGRHRNRATGTN